MKLKNKIFATLLMLIAMGGVSCKKYLDINTSPLVAAKVDPKLLFGYAVTAWDVNKNSGDNYIALGFLGQSLANGGDFSDNWGSSNLYNLSTTIVGNTWRVYYNTAGNNFKQAIAIAESSTPKNNNAAAQCKITFAEMMYEATTLYGDIPYSQAWQGDVYPYPKYDAQKDVLESLLTLLDQAIAQIDVTSTLKISDYDIFYAGDMNAWKRVANTIKFKILMLMVDKDPTKAAAIGALLNAPTSMMSSTTDTWKVKYTTTTNNENPKYRLFLQENPFTYASDVDIALMGQNDPRLPKYFDLPVTIPATTTYKGVAENADADGTTALMSLYLYRKDAPSVIMGYPQLELLEAEAWARGLGVTANLVTANTLYKQGVTDAMKFYEADPTAITTYVNTILPVLTPANALTQIHTQQWIDLIDRPLDAFTQWRRSGVDGVSEIPALTLPKGATPGPLIRRFTLSLDETTANPNVPTPFPKYTDKMWFDL